MMLQIAPIVREFTVKPAPAKAFEIFTTRMGEWVPAEHSLLPTAPRTVTVEPENGGAWYETDTSGARCDWGKVRYYEPPHRLGLVWQLDHEFEFNPEIETFIDVTFESAGTGTLIRFEHSGLESYGEHAAGMRERFEAPGAWTHWFDGLRALIG